MVIKMNYQKLVKEIRKKLIITQEELAVILGVSFASINRWENGKHEPTIKIRRKIVEICKANNIDMVEKKNKNYQLD
jgi:putative transcriptional regulator